MESSPVRALRIVVVDPYAPGRASLCACLEDLGHAVSGARDVVGAIRLLREQGADVLLVDHSPPWSDGWHDLDLLWRECWGLAIVLVDSETPSSAVAAALRKPVSMVDLEREIAGRVVST